MSKCYKTRLDHISQTWLPQTNVLDFDDVFVGILQIYESGFGHSVFVRLRESKVRQTTSPSLISPLHMWAIRFLFMRLNSHHLNLNCRFLSPAGPKNSSSAFTLTYCSLIINLLSSESIIIGTNDLSFSDSLQSNCAQQHIHRGIWLITHAQMHIMWWYDDEKTVKLCNSRLASLYAAVCACL